MNLNKVTLIGNLTKDPELKKLPSGQTITTFGVATNYRWRDAQSQTTKESVEFHDIVAWRRTGEVVVKYLKKGDRVFVDGHLQTRKWKDRQGNQRQRKEVIVDQLIMLGGGKSSTTDQKPNDELAQESVDVNAVPFTS